MRRAIDTLFGRLVVIVIGMLVLSHVAWFAIIRFERDNVQTRFAVEEAVFLVEAVRQHIANTPDQPLPPRVHTVALESPDVPKQPAGDIPPPPLQRFIEDLKDRLPDGTDVRLSEPGGPPSVWVHGAKDAGWIVVPVQPLRPPRSRDRMVVWLVVIFSAAVFAALVGAWQLQYPLRALAQAVQRFGRGQPTPPVPERGPRELRQLTHGFNQMVREVSQTENDRAVMLAGVAHDLKTPLARLRLRAEMMDNEKMRDGVVRDVNSMAHIVDQFLVFAHDRPDGSEPVPVDEQCERIARAYRAVSPGAQTVRLKLEAGPAFVLPAATLDRLLSNLLDNAHAYGAPPVVIETRRDAKGWVLSVSDHGKGIAPDDLIKASRPFVRLDPARGGSGHSGLGLAIVERLARRAGGECEIGNRPEGGLQVTMTFPVELASRPLAERRAGPQQEERAL
ncbi:sensor signal transduction histidine kinase [Caballeronia hypogeia]|uniref:histidine kinase n=1 Tax=Caballeronia hypogeia TaxID=1777140 RepID=A0A157ZWX7_9BURK|nr:ATP-binding protein [Caballeronia hypogeia]SAK50048.1 sensor signal transduction histidine kinase [Caballeronia hypogeia]